MLRHTALFLWRNTTTETQKLTAKKGLAYLSYGCPSARAVDFGTDLQGGSAPLLEVEPWHRTPLWRARRSGPVANYDMALHLDFDDQDGLDAYNKDDVHHEVGVYNASVCREERTARVDWWYEGPPRIENGLIRHTTLFVWDDDVTESQRSDVRAAYREAGTAVPGVRSLLVGDNVGTLTTDFDLIVDVHLAGLPEVEAYAGHPAQKEALALAAAATKYEWTARITHRMASG